MRCRRRQPAHIGAARIPVEPVLELRRRARKSSRSTAESAPGRAISDASSGMPRAWNSAASSDRSGCGSVRRWSCASANWCFPCRARCRRRRTWRRQRRRAASARQCARCQASSAAVKIGTTTKFSTRTPVNNSRQAAHRAKREDDQHRPSSIVDAHSAAPRLSVSGSDKTVRFHSATGCDAASAAAISAPPRRARPSRAPSSRGRTVSSARRRRRTAADHA